MLPAQDWQPNLEPFLKGKRLVEFGLGIGTHFLTDRCKEVKSVEIWPNTEWLDKVTKELKGVKNWSTRLYNLPDEWSKELKEMVIKESQGYDIAFVDPGIHCRPEMVNVLFGVVPTIFCHDTSVGPDRYHWDRFKKDARYIRTDFKKGQGTSLFYLRL